jgi:hypothetical protein
VWSWDSTFGIVSDYELKTEGLSSSTCTVKNFPFSVSFRIVLGCTQTPSQCLSEDISFDIMWPDLEADNSLASSAELKKMCSIYPFSNTPMWDSAKHGNSFVLS